MHNSLDFRVDFFLRDSWFILSIHTKLCFSLQMTHLLESYSVLPVKEATSLLGVKFLFAEVSPLRVRFVVSEVVDSDALARRSMSSC